jgi:hypothetical protein
VLTGMLAVTIRREGRRPFESLQPAIIGLFGHIDPGLGLSFSPGEAVVMHDVV